VTLWGKNVVLSTDMHSTGGRLDQLLYHLSTVAPRNRWRWRGWPE